jgi:hypothetical protein
MPRERRWLSLGEEVHVPDTCQPCFSSGRATWRATKPVPKRNIDPDPDPDSDSGFDRRRPWRQRRSGRTSIPIPIPVPWLMGWRAMRWGIGVGVGVVIGIGIGILPISCLLSLKLKLKLKLKLGPISLSVTSHIMTIWDKEFVQDKNNQQEWLTTIFNFLAPQKRKWLIKVDYQSDQCFSFYLFVNYHLYFIYFCLANEIFVPSK